MTTYSFTFLQIALIIGFSHCEAQRLDLFSSDTKSLHNKSYGLKARISYPEIKTYYGYLEADSSKTVNKAPGVSLFFQLENDVNEIGVRLISPVPENVFPNKGEIVSEFYNLNQKDRINYFDPVIKIYKANKSIDEKNLDSKDLWEFFGENDNNDELFLQPSGKRNNALIRTYDKKNPQLPICKKGVYRIDVFPADTIMTAGSFLLQVGGSSEVPVIRVFEK